MTINTKFNLGDLVYFVGEHKIYQAFIVEVRFINRYEEQTSTKLGVREENLILYRLAETKTHQSGFNNTNEDNVPNYKGEFQAYLWFPENILFNTSEQALNSIKVKYLNNHEIPCSRDAIEEVLNDPF